MYRPEQSIYPRGRLRLYISSVYRRVSFRYSDGYNSIIQGSKQNSCRPLKKRTHNTRYMLRIHAVSKEPRGLTLWLTDQNLTH